MPAKNLEPIRQRFGAHMSVAGGLHLAFDIAAEAGCDCLQIFVKNQRQWRAKPLADEHAHAYREAQRRTGITPVVAHASYLINLASPVEAARKKSIAAMVDELQRCEALSVEALVVHPGAHMGEGEVAGIARIAESLDEIHAATAGFRSRVALECTAGQGTTLGYALSHLGRMIDATREPDRLRVCLDTCHLFAAGYDLSKRDDYERMTGELEKSFGFAAVCCIHANDSKTPCGSRLDRHAHVGEGTIGRAGFRNILTDPRLAHAPRILETAKGTNARGRDLDRVNLARLRRLARPR